jgi:hypothetical protein
MAESLWFEKGRLTRTAQEIFDRSRRFLESVPPLDSRTQDQLLEEDILQVMLEGAPIDIGLLTEWAAQNASELRPVLKGEHGLDPFDPRMFPDDQILGMIAGNPLWLKHEAVAARVADRRADARSTEASRRVQGARFLEKLVRSEPRHRPRRRPDDRIVSHLLQKVEAWAREIQKAWWRLRADYPDETMLELGRRLHEVLEGTAQRRLLGENVKGYLAGLGAIVLDKDNRRYVSIEDPGWPRAVGLTMVSVQLRQSKTAVLAAYRATRS